MTLQGSGPISMNDINVELNRSGTATIGLNQAESGTYAAINTASTSRPNGSTPNSMNEWYGYNHNAVTLYSQSVQTMSNIYECCGSANNTKYSTCSTVTTGCTMYNTNNTSSPYASGAFQDINTGYVFTTNGSGVVDAQYGCYC